MSPYSQEFRRLWLGGSRSDWLGRVVFGVLTDARRQTPGLTAEDWGRRPGAS